MSKNSKEYNKANYQKYWGQPKQIADRSARNSARREMGVKKGDSREVDHIKGIGGGNGKGNLRVISQAENRRLGQKKAMKGRTHNYSFAGNE